MAADFVTSVKAELRATLQMRKDPNLQKVESHSQQFPKAPVCMPVENPQRKVIVLLERLRRPHDLAIRHHDEPALNALAHELRLWSEIPTGLAEAFPRVGTSRAFRTASPIRAIKKLVSGQDFVLAYLPGGAATYSNRGELFSGPKRDSTVGGRFKPSIGHLELESFYSIGSYVNDEDIQLLQSKRHKPEVKRVTFTQWMGSEIFRFRRDTGTSSEYAKNPARGVFLKRMANYYAEGSHSSFSRSDSDLNELDEHLDWLTEFQLGELPLPYFLLLKTAQDILRQIPDLVGVRTAFVDRDGREDPDRPPPDPVSWKPSR